MALKYAVLGALTERRGYGYELVQRLETRLGPAWRLSASTVYAALDQLEAEGWIRSRAEGGRDPERSDERRGARRVVYEASEEGRDALAAWLARPSLRAEPIRTELALKLAVARRDDLPVLLDAIAQAARVATATRAECAAAAGLGGGRRWEDATAALVGAAAIARLDGELRWLGVAQRALESLARGDRAPAIELIPPS